MLERGDELRVSIRDDGGGFDPEAPASGFGLTGMRERISLAGGRIEISSSAAGTTITAMLPAVSEIRRTA